METARQIVTARVRKRATRCYELAGREIFESEDPNRRLIHGYTRQWPFGHAWVEFSDGSIFEPTLKVIMEPDLHERWAEPEVRYRVTRDQLVDMLVAGVWANETV